jgi:uncharacterized membrane protein
VPQLNYFCGEIKKGIETMIEFEHTIFILLLLSGVLNAKPPRQRWATLIILVGVLLVFLPPASHMPVPWETILGMFIPLLLWQNTRRLVNADWRGWNSVTLWAITVLIFGLALALIGDLNWPGALLFGMIAGSMIWRAGEPEVGTSYMSQINRFVRALSAPKVFAQIPCRYWYWAGLCSLLARVYCWFIGGHSGGDQRNGFYMAEPILPTRFS